MKKSLLLITLLVALVTAFTSAQNSTGQANTAPFSVNYGYVYPLPVKQYPESTLVKSFASRVDTFYAKYWINRTSGAYQTPEYIKNLGFFNRVSITVDVNDSMSVGLVVKHRTRSRGTGAASTWATTLTDSLVCTTAGGIVKEFSINDADSDLYDALDVETMIIATTNAWGLDYTGNVAGTNKRQVRLNFAH